MAKKKTVLSVLMDARKLIGSKKRWTQNANAKSKTGKDVQAESRSAVSWCAYGAVHRCAGTRDSLATDAFRFVDKAAPHNNAILYNDKEGRQHRHILSMFGRAIALARKAAKAST